MEPIFKVIDKQTGEDESFVIPIWTGECFWCGECMLETSNDAYVCPVCGWRYRGREGE